MKMIIMQHHNPLKIDPIGIRAYIPIGIRAYIPIGNQRLHPYRDESRHPVIPARLTAREL